MKSEETCSLQAKGNNDMLSLNIVRQLTAAVSTLIGYPPIVSDDLRGRLLR